MSGRDNRGTPESSGYQIFMLVLCVFAISAVAIRMTTDLAPGVAGILDYADNLVCVIFFLDFIFSLWRAPKKLTYLLTWGWIDLLSSIPMLNFSRWGRLARIARLLRVLRVLRATKIVASAILRRRAENGFLAIILTAILLIIFASIAILQCESAPDSNIKSAADAMWWAVTTITTVGYGDRYPVTSDGRIVASIVMFAGVGLISTFSGFLAAWFLAPPTGASQPELVGLRYEVAALREAIEKMISQRN